MSKFSHISKNKSGTDYVCGDIHGRFSDLETQLDRIGFNKETDRLFALGDLIDRGAESDRVVEYLDEPWFYSITGNHEMMMVNAHREVVLPYSSRYWMPIWLHNGGLWATHLTENQVSTIISVICALPLALELEIDDERSVGLVHAELIRRDWNDIREMCEDLPLKHTEFAWSEYPDQSQLIQEMVWGRSKIDNKDTFSSMHNSIKNIHHVFHGHSLVSGPTTLGNCTYLDTGSGYEDGFITILDIKDFVDSWDVHP